MRRPAHGSTGVLDPRRDAVDGGDQRAQQVRILAIALAPAEKVDEIAEAILAAAQDAGHPTPDFYLVTAGAPGQRLV